jgi:hypothetical protein
MKLTPFLSLIRRYSWGHLVVAGGFTVAGIFIGRSPSVTLEGILIFVIAALVFGLLTED